MNQSEARKLFMYEPTTGWLLWRIARSNKIKIGDRAGYLSEHRKGKFYLKVNVNNKMQYVHRIIWLYVYGSYPADLIDHKDGNGLNNKLDNLRLATPSENNRNTKQRIDNKVNCTGVCWNKRKSKYSTEICIEKQRKHLGYFCELWDAICARKSAEFKLNFNF